MTAFVAKHLPGARDRRDRGVAEALARGEEAVERKQPRGASWSNALERATGGIRTVVGANAACTLIAGHDAPSSTTGTYHRRMRVLLTGMSGTGKSTLVQELRRRGYAAYDADDGVSEPRAHGRWGWRADLIADLLATASDRLLFFAGCSEEQIDLPFDYRVLLTAPTSVLMQRLDSRTSNSYGRDSQQRVQVLADVAEVEPLLRRSADLVLATTVPNESLPMSCSGGLRSSGRALSERRDVTADDSTRRSVAKVGAAGSRSIAGVVVMSRAPSPGQRRARLSGHRGEARARHTHRSACGSRAPHLTARVASSCGPAQHLYDQEGEFERLLGVEPRVAGRLVAR